MTLIDIEMEFTGRVTSVILWADWKEFRLVRGSSIEPLVQELDDGI